MSVPHPADCQSVLVLGEPEGLSMALMRRLEQGGVAAEPAMALSDSEASRILTAKRWGSQPTHSGRRSKRSETYVPSPPLLTRV